MSEIRTTKIDWVEFVTYKDYLRLKEEKQELEYLWDINEDLKKDNEELKKDNQELKWLVDINRELRKENKKLKEENQKLKEKIAEYENLPF